MAKNSRNAGTSAGAKIRTRTTYGELLADAVIDVEGQKIETDLMFCFGTERRYSLPRKSPTAMLFIVPPILTRASARH